MRSRLVAVSGSSRCSATMKAASSRVVPRIRMWSSTSVVMRVPTGTLAALAGLADVVEQRAEQQPVSIEGVGERGSRQGVVGVGRREQPAHLERRREMHIDRESMVRVALGSAPHRAPGRQHARQETETVQRVQGCDAGLPRPQDAQERLAVSVVH